MKIDRKELLQILEKVKPGVAKTNHIEGMSYFYFSGDNIVTYNDKISIQHPIKTEFSLFINAGNMYKIISKLTTDTVTLLKKEDKLHVTCSEAKANLATIEDKEVYTRIRKVTKSLKKDKWKTLPENFSNSIMLCSFTASKQESDGTLTCIYMNGTDCVASDNNRISHAILDSPIDEMFIKASESKDLVNMMPKEYMITKSWLHFKNEDGTIFSIRAMSGKFPNFLPFFKFDGTNVVIPDTLIKGIDITTILADAIDPVIVFKLSNGKILLSAKSDSGTIDYKAKISYKGENITIIINPIFLKEMLAHSSSIVIGEDKVKLKTDDEKFALLTALMA